MTHRQTPGDRAGPGLFPIGAVMTRKKDRFVRDSFRRTEGDFGSDCNSQHQPQMSNLKTADCNLYIGILCFLILFLYILNSENTQSKVIDMSSIMSAARVPFTTTPQPLSLVANGSHTQARREDLVRYGMEWTGVWFRGYCKMALELKSKSGPKSSYRQHRPNTRLRAPFNIAV